MRRIAIVGNGGSGKSTLARELGRRLGLPVVHLDAHYWRPGWVPAPDDEWERTVARLAAADAWVMDGNFQTTLPLRAARADAILFLDLPRAACLRAVLSRWLHSRGEVREDMATGCPEQFDPGFLKWVWGYPRRSRPTVLATVDAFGRNGGMVRVFRSRREIAAFLAGIASSP